MSSTEDSTSLDTRHWSWKKKVFFSLLPVLCLLLTAEVVIRVVVFQSRTEYPLALMEQIEELKNRVALSMAQRSVEVLDIPKGVYEALFSDEGKELLQEFQTIYERHFEMLVQELNREKVKLIVLYVPSMYPDGNTRIMEKSVHFFSVLCKKYQVDFLDVTVDCLKYPVEAITLHPFDPHPSRFGNQVVADSIGGFIARYRDYRSDARFEKRPRLLGDLPPNLNRTSKRKSQLPFLLTTNSQGLRMTYDLESPKRKQRILLLGDSYTFGEHLHDQDTLGEILNRRFSDREFVNAAVCGYTITDEVSLYLERAKYLEPDLVVLQVLDNDFYGLFYFKQNQFDRNRGAHHPSPLEKQFLDDVKKRQRGGA